jgi:alkylation response protein AidB-like acyl-CoA dehydrogenase
MTGPDAALHAAFRMELRARIQANLPPDIRHRVENDLYLHKEDYVRWNKILRGLGYFAKTWPKEYGGPGWDIVQQLIFEQENARAGAPMVLPYGIGMVGPVLIEFGTPAQRERYLPGILDSSTWWCQGYSEPNAGSDLASLRTRAVREGDMYVVNGTKMWTTQGHYADMMHALVRTDSSGRKQQGITFLLIDMKAPGVSLRPIITIDGVHHTNQVFFDNVRVPVENRVGEEGAGWRIAKFLLSHERTSSTESGAKFRLLKRIEKQIASFSGSPELIPAFRLRHTQLRIEVAILAEMERMLIARWHAGGQQQLAHEAAVLKVRATEIEQALTRLSMELRGPYSIAFDVASILAPELPAAAAPWQVASGSTYQYLRARSATIYAGSNEIQRNIIAGAFLA